MRRHATTRWCLLALLCLGAASKTAPQCPMQESAHGSCDAQAHEEKSTALLQKQSHRIVLSGTPVEEVTAKTSAQEKGKPHAYQVWKSDEKVSSALHYFKWWSAGKLKYRMEALPPKKDPERLPDSGMVQVKQSKASVEHVTNLLSKHKQKFCPRAGSLTESGWKMRMKHHDDNGVGHVLMRSAEGLLQYAAFLSEDLLAADPEVCSRQDLVLAEETQSESSEADVTPIDNWRHHLEKAEEMKQKGEGRRALKKESLNESGAAAAEPPKKADASKSEDSPAAEEKLGGNESGEASVTTGAQLLDESLSAHVLKLIETNESSESLLDKIFPPLENLTNLPAGAISLAGENLAESNATSDKSVDLAGLPMEKPAGSIESSELPKDAAEASTEKSEGFPELVKAAWREEPVKNSAEQEASASFEAPAGTGAKPVLEKDASNSTAEADRDSVEEADTKKLEDVDARMQKFTESNDAADAAEASAQNLTDVEQPVKEPTDPAAKATERNPTTNDAIASDGGDGSVVAGPSAENEASGKSPPDTFEDSDAKKVQDLYARMRKLAESHETAEVRTDVAVEAAGDSNASTEGSDDLGPLAKDDEKGLESAEAAKDVNEQQVLNDQSAGANVSAEVSADKPAEADTPAHESPETNRSAEASVGLAAEEAAVTRASPWEAPPVEEGCDWKCYLDRYSDLRDRFGVDNEVMAAKHYADYGKTEGRDCTCPGVCDWQCYVDRYDDVRQVVGADLAAAERHYKSYGEQEERDCTCPGPLPDDGGDPELLDVNTDPLVADCVKLFHRTAQQRCGKDFDIKPLSATLRIIAGFAVNAMVQVNTGQYRNTEFHEIECDFAMPSTLDAELLQLKNASLADGNQEQLPEEKDGLEATLRMVVDVCKADTSSSAGEEASLLAEYTFGHLPAYKGYEHLAEEEYDNIPVFLPQRGTAPATFNLMAKAPECFPDRGREIVRSQGTCGSCWAFATASALMTNLCVNGRGRHSLASRSDRFEISVQGLMSCNNFRGQKQGCSGGNAYGADTALKKYGIGKERDFRYKCGGGKSEDHFDKRNTKCTSGNGWGASCSFTKNPNWIYGGILSAGGGWNSNAGEEKIKQTLVECGSGYISFKVYANFMQYKSGVYSSISGGRRGGHAVTLLGYGAQGSTKYWWIQNSWGPNWGNNGYVNFLRGRNLAEIESAYWCIKGTVKAGGSGPLPPSPGPQPRPPRPPSPGPSPNIRPGTWSQSLDRIENKVDQALRGLAGIKAPLDEAKREIGALRMQSPAPGPPSPAPINRPAPPAPAPAPPRPSPPRRRVVRTLPRRRRTLPRRRRTLPRRRRTLTPRRRLSYSRSRRLSYGRSRRFYR